MLRARGKKEEDMMRRKSFVVVVMIMFMLAVGCSNNRSSVRERDKEVSAENDFDEDEEDDEEDRETINLTLPEIEGEPITKIVDTADSIIIGMTEQEDRYYFFDHLGNLLFSTESTNNKPVCYQKYIFIKDKIIDYKGNALFDIDSSEYKAITDARMLDEDKIICAKDDDLYLVDFLQGTSSVVNMKKVRLHKSKYMENGYYIDVREGLKDDRVWIYDALSNMEYPLDGDEDRILASHLFSDLTYQIDGENVYYWMDDAIDLGRYCLALSTGKVEFQEWKSGLKSMNATAVKYVYLSDNDIFDAELDRFISLDKVLESEYDGNAMEAVDVFNKTEDGKYLLYIRNRDSQDRDNYFLVVDSSGDAVVSWKEAGPTKGEKHSDLFLLCDKKKKIYNVYNYEGEKISCVAEADVGNKSLLGKDSMVFLGEDTLYVSADDETLVKIKNFEAEHYSKECDVYFGMKDGCFFGLDGSDASLYCLSVK